VLLGSGTETDDLRVPDVVEGWLCADRYWLMERCSFSVATLALACGGTLTDVIATEVNSLGKQKRSTGASNSVPGRPQPYRV